MIRALGIPAPRACKIPVIGPAIVKADCIRLKVASEFIVTDYVMSTLNSPPTQHRTELKIHGVGRPRLNLGEVKAIAIPLPPLAEQRQIVRKVERRLTAANRLATTESRLSPDRSAWNRLPGTSTTARGPSAKALRNDLLCSSSQGKMRVPSCPES